LREDFHQANRRNMTNFEGKAQRTARRKAKKIVERSARHGASEKKIARRSTKRGAESSKFRCALRFGVDLDYQPKMNINNHIKFEGEDFADKKWSEKSRF
jgi:hypothetical protein